MALAVVASITAWRDAVFGWFQADKARATWVEMIWCRALEDADGRKVRAAAQQAADLVLVELVLCLTAQSAGFMYR